MNVPLYQVDAFASRPFQGNPAAVCLLSEAAEDTWLQAVAMEMNLSETAFLLPEGDDYRLRWFTPTVEVDLCGHATLASAHILWETERLEAHQPARFHARSGLLTAERRDGWIVLDFPAMPPNPMAEPPELKEALGQDAVFVGRNATDLMVEVSSEEAVRSIQPNMGLLTSLPYRGVMVTARSTSPEFDFVSRFFGPQSGIPEDPVTGSAHCCLGPYWKDKLVKDRLMAYQASKRGGVVSVEVAGDRIRLGGQAVTVLRGEWVAD